MAGSSRSFRRKARKPSLSMFYLANCAPTMHLSKWLMAAFIESDDFFAQQMRHASNVVIAITPELHPPDLFATNALALGGISTDKDSDGTLRRVEAFHTYHRWHPLLKKGGGGIRP